MSIKDRLGKLVTAAKEVSERTKKTVSDAYEREDTQAAFAWAKRTADATADEAIRLGKEIARSDMAKDAATGAAIGAAVAVPIPVVGPIAGAVVGAGLGVYKNFVKPAAKSPALTETISIQEKRIVTNPEIYEALVKFDELRQKGILTDAEFEAQKTKLLGEV